MSRVGVKTIAKLLLSAALVPAFSSTQAAMECLDCHQIHNSPGGTLNTAAEFDLICDTCHGPAGTAVFADRHVDPDARYENDPDGTVAPAWELTCITCHTAHGSDAVNHLYNDGAAHAHTLGGDTGNLVQGINIKLFGRDEDGTGIARVAIPLKVLGLETDSPHCTNSSTDLRVSLPTFAEGEGPLHTVMVGDRFDITNTDSAYAGVWRVKETKWDTFLNTDGQGMVCFDGPAATGPPPFLVTNASYNTQAATAMLTLDRAHPFRKNDIVTVSGINSSGPGNFNGTFALKRVPSNSEIEYDLANDPGSYISGGSIPDSSGTSPVANAYGQSRGWHNRPKLGDATWTAGTATLTLRGIFSIRDGDTVSINGVISDGPGSFAGLATVTAVTSSRVSNAVWAAGTATLTLTDNHLYQAGETIVVKDVSSSGPATLNGTFTVSGTSGLDVSYALASDPGGYIGSNGSVAIPTGISRITYALATDPGAATDVSSTSIEYVGSLKSVQSIAISGATTMNITLTTNDAGINQFQAATAGVRDGDIITLSGVEPNGYNGRWEVESVSLPTIGVRCPPFTRTALSLPACSLSGVPAYVSGGDIQSTGSMRVVVFESRGGDNNVAGFLSDYTHGFSNTDEDVNGYMDGPCETCHTQAGKHNNDDFGDTHNNSRTCTDGCHSHSVGFDKANDFCPAGRTCPPTN